MAKPILFIFVVLIFVTGACKSGDERILDINLCYEKKLDKIRNSNLYENIFSAFEDTFLVLKTQIKYFGVPWYVENYIDDALFRLTSCSRL